MKEIALLFLKLGTIAFGGPAAHIGMMEDEVVNKRKWMDRQHFLDLVGATNLIPGPNSTEMAIHCGYHRGGLPGLIVAGVSFIFPAMLITTAFAWLYVSYGSLPAIEPFFYGIKPAVLAVILSAIYRLGQKALKGWKTGLIGAGVLIVSFAGISEVIAILAGGVIGMFWLYFSKQLQSEKILPAFVPISLAIFPNFKALLITAAVAAAGAITVAQIFWVFLKVGAILFGSGYVLVAYLDAELVNRLGWLTRRELLDAIAIGQFTPGPVLSASTFIGYQIHGLSGAVWATAGIFLPSFLFVLILNPLVPKLRKSRLTSCFLDAVNIGAVAIMVVVILKMGKDILLDWRATVIALQSLVLVFGFRKIATGWAVVMGAACGYLLNLV